MAIESPIQLDLTEAVTDPIQCTVCGQPNLFGQLCESCLAELTELEAADADTRRTYLALGLRCVNQELGGNSNG